MAIIADITVKKADGTTNITYVAVQGAAGDANPARWRSDTANPVRAFRDTLSMVAKPNGPATARRVNVTYSGPVVRTVNSVDTLVGTIPGELSILIPNNLTDTEVAEKVEQYLNLLASPAVRSAIKAGFAPT